MYKLHCFFFFFLFFYIFWSVELASHRMLFALRGVVSIISILLDCYEMRRAVLLSGNYTRLD